MSSISLETNNNIFQASWPKSLEPTLCQKVWRCVWNILCATILLPVGIVRLLNHYLIRPIALYGLILPAMMFYEHDYTIPESELDPIKKIRFKNASGESVESYFYKGKKHPDKLIILSHGNGMHCLDFDEVYPILMQSGISILTINHMGVGKSKGMLGTKGLNTEESLGISVFSAFEHAVKELNFSKEDILVYGFSLGGMAATIGETYIQDTYGEKAVKLINDRSLNGFSQYAAKLAAMIHEAIKETPCSQLKWWAIPLKMGCHIIPACLVKLVAKCLVALAGIKGDATAAFKKLKGKNKCLIYSKEDEIIPYREVSLYKSVKEEENFSRIKLRKGHTHVGPFRKKEAKYILAQIYKFLDIQEEDTTLIKHSRSTDHIYRRYAVRT